MEVSTAEEVQTASNELWARAISMGVGRAATTIHLVFPVYPSIPLLAREEALVNPSMGFEAIQQQDLGVWRIRLTYLEVIENKTQRQ